jgi:hypothetical protein
VIGKRLETPEKIRSLQKKLYVKAKAEPDFRFYLLYDKVCREDILEHAYRVSRANAGAPGVDGVSFVDIDLAGAQEWLSGIRKSLCERTYRPDPVRRVDSTPTNVIQFHRDDASSTPLAIRASDPPRECGPSGSGVRAFSSGRPCCGR